MIVIIDYDMGNVRSILNMLKRIGAPAMISGKADDLLAADKIILPGVGAFDSAMENLNRQHLLPAMNQKVCIDRIPILGICLGMQLLSRHSEEGTMEGLGWIDAITRRFQFAPERNGFRIPHMGWNDVMVTGTSPLFNKLEQSARFYFVHSFHMVCNRPSDILAETSHGYDFTSAVSAQNIFGVQFHPEKSHRFGLQLLKNFVEID